MDCLFCQIVAGTIPSHKVYEDDATLAFLDIHPAGTGHTLVISKAHAEGLLDLPAAALAATSSATQTVARILQKHLHTDGINVIQNNGSAAGQEVFHYHVHLIPRRQGDGVIRLWRPGATDHPALASLAAELRAAGGT
jgi:histidine triad (HIT) family protein